MATAATVHVLLNKRNVPSAIGWIGLVWLSPFIGTLLYFGFGINRVRRKARSLRRTNQKRVGNSGNGLVVEEPFYALKKSVGALTNQQLTTARISIPMHNGDDAYPMMLDAIDKAKTSIGLTSYIFRSDKMGLDFVQALARAVERGVLVRVLIDGFGGGLFRSPTFRLLSQHNVPVARFMSSVLPWKIQFLNLRLHKKILVIDGMVAFMGGLNIADENVISFRNVPKVRDTHFKIEGSVVRQITADFIEDWYFTTGELLPDNVWHSSNQISALSPARLISSGPDQEIERLFLVLLSAVFAAHRSIRIATPYFLPDEQLVTALQLAALRGVDVTIVIPEVNDHPLLGWAARAHLPPLLNAGCRVWLAPLPFDHSKLMTVDDEWCLFGSPNWDTRSLRLNFEAAIEAYDPALASQLATIIDQDCVTPLTLQQLESRSAAAKCRDAISRLLMPYL